jgi:hypothetical protein
MYFYARLFMEGIMPEIVFDFGNARGKWFYPRVNEYEDFRHAIAFLDESDWRKVAGRGKPPKGILKVNGAVVAIGDVARRYIIADRPKGAARYKRNYYGPPLAFAMAEAFQKTMSSVTLIASHAPQDIDYARNLIHAAQGEWYVESHYGELYFCIKEVHTYDEPLGGYSHYVLTEKGDERKKNPLRDSTTLVVDVGGHTIDVAAVDPGGEIDPLSLDSKRAGVIKMTEEFETYLRSNNQTLFQDAGDLDIRRVEDAILTGVYKFGKVPVSCVDEARTVINGLVDDIVQVMTNAGGPANYDTVLLTGGGSALVYDALQAAYPRIEFVLAEPDRSLMKYANVFGGAKLTALLQRIGVW